MILPTAPDTAVTHTPAAVPVGMPSVAMGLLLPPGARLISTPGSCRRAWPNLFYCLTSLSRGATKRIVIDVTAPLTPTTITTSGYARKIDTMDETSAIATLTVG